MSQMKQLTLNQLGAGQSGTVIQILGGRGLGRRLDALGIRPGKEVTKISSMLFRGPVTVKVDSTQVAIGFRMAGRVVVEAHLTTNL